MPAPRVQWVRLLIVAIVDAPAALDELEEEELELEELLELLLDEDEELDELEEDEELELLEEEEDELLLDSAAV